MKMFLLSDNNDTLTGMRLAGVDGVLITEQLDFEEELKKACERKNTAILLITEKLSNEHRKLVIERMITNELPMIITIPDRHGMGREKDFIDTYVKEAIGINI